MTDQPKRRGRPPKDKKPVTQDHGAYEIREVAGKYLIYLRGSIRAIRHTEQEAKEYIAMVS